MCVHEEMKKMKMDTNR